MTAAVLPKCPRLVGRYESGRWVVFNPATGRMASSRRLIRAAWLTMRKRGG